MVAPGEARDKRGVPIYPGDLLKSPHFVDRRGRRHWLYHVAVQGQRCMEMVPVSHLEPTKVLGGGRCWLSHELARIAEVIEGYGPGQILDFHDRKRHKEIDACSSS